MKTEAEFRVMNLKDKDTKEAGSHQRWAGGGRKVPLLEPSESHCAADTLISDFWSPELRKKKLLLF